jgi:hypothetical protein
VILHAAEVKGANPNPLLDVEVKLPIAEAAQAICEKLHVACNWRWKWYTGLTSALDANILSLESMLKRKSWHIGA